MDFETKPRGPLDLSLLPWAEALKPYVLLIYRLKGGPMSMVALGDQLAAQGLWQWPVGARLYRGHPDVDQLGRIVASLYFEGELKFMDQPKAPLSGDEALRQLVGRAKA